MMRPFPKLLPRSGFILVLEPFEKEIFQGCAHGRQRDQPAAAMANDVDGPLQQSLGQHRPEDGSAAVGFCPELDIAAPACDAFPDDLDLAADFAHQVGHHPYAAQLAMVQNRHAVAQRLSVGKDVGRKKRSSCLRP